VTRSTMTIVGLVALAVGAGAFLATVQSRAEPAESPACPLGEWLRLPTDQCRTVCGADPTFRTESADLARQVGTERLTLADLLEDPATPGPDILAQLDRVTEAHAALERRVAEHLLIIRPLLTPEQQRKLLAFCAEGVRARCRKPCAGGGQAGCPRSAGGICLEGGCEACAGGEAAHAAP